MKNLRDMDRAELTEEVLALGEKPYRALQIYAWVYKRGVTDIDEMTDVSKAFRERMKEFYFIAGPQSISVTTSADGTQKFVSTLEDGARIESVIIPEEARTTLCVSTQAGCALGCAFCLTGKGGFTRNLTLSELTGQVFSAMSLLPPDKALTNVVLMGMGEPLANCDAVIRFVNILTDGGGFGFSNRKVTVSTAGLVPGIERLGAEAKVSLAVSLNATTDAVRTGLMPINKKYPLAELVPALKAYAHGGNRSVTVEYVLLRGVNDTAVDARRLASLLRGLSCKINLIPFNPWPGARYERPSDQDVASFVKTLRAGGYVAVVRHSRGADILAACGQLKARYDG